MSQALAPLLWTLAGLLVVAGAAKLRDPAPTARAQAVLGLPAWTAVARAIGGAEVAIGAACLARPSAASAAALAAAYLAFAAVVVLLRRTEDAADCGCFGERSFAPTTGHAVLNLLAATAAALAATSPPPGIGSYLAGAGPLTGTAAGLGVAAAVLLSYLVFTRLPEAWGAYAGGGGHGAA